MITNHHFRGRRRPPPCDYDPPPPTTDRGSKYTHPMPPTAQKLVRMDMEEDEEIYQTRTTLTDEEATRRRQHRWERYKVEAKKCEFCKELMGDVLCTECNMVLCATCSEKVHRPGGADAGHTLEAI